MNRQGLLEEGGRELNFSRVRVLLLLAVFVFGIAGCADKGAQAQPTARLFTTPASAGGGTMSCFAVNVGGATLSEVRVKLVRADSGSFFQQICNNVEPREGCILSMAPEVPRYCLIEVAGGEASSVRGSLTIQDSTGATVLSLEAR
jgi:hypothetical protein